MPKDGYLFSPAIVMRPQLLLLLLGFDIHTLWSSPNPTTLPTLHLFSTVTPWFPLLSMLEKSILCQLLVILQQRLCRSNVAV